MIMQEYYVLGSIALLIAIIYFTWKYMPQIREVAKRIASSAYDSFKEELYETILLLSPDEYDDKVKMLRDLADGTYEYISSQYTNGCVDLQVTAEYVIDVLEEIGIEVNDEQEEIVKSVINIIVKWMER